MIFNSITTERDETAGSSSTENANKIVAKESRPNKKSKLEGSMAKKAEKRVNAPQFWHV